MPRTIIVGLGGLSTQFTEKFVKALVNNRKPEHGIVAVGVYDNGNGVAGPKVRKSIKRQRRRLKADDISITPDPNRKFQVSDAKLDDLVTMREHIQEYRPDTLFLITDAEFLRSAEYVDVWRVLKVASVDLEITVICFSSEISEDERAYELLEMNTRQDSMIKAPMFEGAFVIRSDSPLDAAFGGTDTQMDLLAKSLAGIYTAPLHRNYNPNFADQVKRLRQGGKAFVSLAVKSQGITMIKPEKGIKRLLYPLLRHSTRYISKTFAVDTIENLTRTILNDLPPVTTTIPFNGLGTDIHALAISVNLIVPFRANTSKFDDIANQVEAKLRSPGVTRIQEDIIAAQPESGAKTRGATPQAGKPDNGYNMVKRSIVPGKGINLSTKTPGTVTPVKDKYYCQVCVLYMIERSQVSFLKLSQRAEG
jgi:hypothetical protein